MPDIDLSAAFGREPEEIVEWFEDKGFEISWSWRDTWQEANADAFTVAKVTKKDVLVTIRSRVEEALSEGKTFGQFQNDLQKELRDLGWWGEKEIVNEQTGEVETTTFNPSRLRTIYRTNLQTSYMAGRWNGQRQAIDRRPYGEYRAVLDPSTRPDHRAADGTVLPLDDPFFDTHYPPNGWGCRCRVVSLSERQVQRRNLTVQSGEEVENFASEGWRYHPGKAAFEPDLDGVHPQIREDFETDTQGDG